MTENIQEEHYMAYSDLSELSSNDIELIESSKKACDGSYSPYSKFEVGAAVRLSNGRIVLGSNQENASYPSGLCAERVALFHIGTTYKNEQIEKIAVTARRSGSNEYLPVSPCGSCRQVMLEYEHRQHDPIKVLMMVENNKWILTKSCEVLLPFCFNKDSL